jgi:hypothetical protein
MKLTDLRRKLGAAFAAGGLLAPGIAHAANLNTNLVLNPGFENVDINTWVPVAGVDPLAFAVKILDWGGTEMGFAYSHAGLTTGEGGAIGDFANGGPLPSGGNFYFTSNATMMPTPGITSPSQFFQEIDVSTGASGNLIASGIANYKVGAFFSSHLTDGDFGSVHVDFLDSANNSLATAVVSDNDVTTWSQNFGGGPIPIGTAKVRLSVFGTALTARPDGYVDNVDFQVTNEMLQPALQINVNRDTGAISLVNQTGGPASFKSYSITSEYGSLEPASWLSIAENYDAGSPGANQVDPAHDWSKLTDESTHGDLSEADLQGAVGATISHTRTINLGNAWLQAPTEDLVFQYISGDQVVQGIVNYTGHSGSAFANGDFNFDSAINSADWMIFRANQHGDFTGKSGAEAYQMGDISGDSQNNHTDFVIFKTLYDAANGAGAFVAMLAAVPEPSAAVLVLTAGLFTLPLRRRVRDGG